MNAFLSGLIVAAVAAWPLYRFLLAIRSRQTVSEYLPEHAQKQGTPTMGGLLILAGLVGVVAHFVTSGKVAFGLGLAAFLLLLAGVGFLDDFVIPRMMPGKRGLGWIPKLALQVGTTAVGLAFLGVSGSGLLLGTLAILFYANAYNFADGLDWLSGTILVAFVLGVLLIGSKDGVRGDLCLGTLGAMIPFLVLNRPKAKIFMGDVGSMPLGGLLGILTISLVVPSFIPALGQGETVSSGRWIAAVILSFMMVAELVPVPLQILSVKLRKKRIFPATPIHHAFQRAGWPETRIVALFAGVQLACSLLAWVISR